MSTPIPDNSAEFTLAEVLRATGGERWVRSDQTEREDADIAATGVITDSRKRVAGKLFVALKGEHFDGHRFLEQAAEDGARIAVVEHPHPQTRPELVQVVVPCTLTALADLALYHRRRWGGKVIAVAGSAGKTTTKGCVSAALSALYPGRVHFSKGNLNNRVGAPLVLLGCRPEHELVVLELGTNQRGEIAELTRMSEPDLGLLTLIDYEHTEGIGDLDAIEQEEGALLRGLSPAGIALGNADDERVRRQLSLFRASRGASPGAALGYGELGSAEYRLMKREALEARGSELQIERSQFPGETIRLSTPLLGYPGALATVAAFAVAEQVRGWIGPSRALTEERRWAAASGSFTAEELEQFSLGINGGEAHEAGRLVAKPGPAQSLLLDDTYNANPASVLSSLKVATELARARGGRLLAVLGEMRELGPLSEQEHRRVGVALAELPVAHLVGVQGDARLMVEEAAARNIPAEFVATPAQALALVLGLLSPKDLVLVKGSRGVRLEQVVDGLFQAADSVIGEPPPRASANQG